MFDFVTTNGTAANRLRPIGGPWSFFSRLRIRVGGQIFKVIDLFARVSEMFNTFTAEGSRYIVFVEGFGAVWEGYGDKNALILAGANNVDVVKDTQMRDTWSVIPDSSI